jgi:hypothetical protein
LSWIIVDKRSSSGLDEPLLIVGSPMIVFGWTVVDSGVTYDSFSGVEYQTELDIVRDYHQHFLNHTVLLLTFNRCDRIRSHGLVNFTICGTNSWWLARRTLCKFSENDLSVTYHITRGNGSTRDQFQFLSSVLWKFSICLPFPALRNHTGGNTQLKKKQGTEVPLQETQWKTTETGARVKDALCSITFIWWSTVSSLLSCSFLLPSMYNLLLALTTHYIPQGPL